MTIKKKFGTGAVFATILLAAILLVPVVSAQGNETTQENETVKLTFGPETLDKLKSDPYCIATYGSIPAFTTVEERYHWIDTLNNIMDKLFSVKFAQDPEMMKYFDPIGPVRTSSATFDGIIEISINNSSTVDKPFMDEFYQIIDSKAISMGVKEVPVVFMRENNLTLAEIESLGFTNIESSGSTNIELPNSTINDSNSINESTLNTSNSSGNKSSKINSIPGFELLGSLICLYGGWKLRKK